MTASSTDVRAWLAEHPKEAAAAGVNIPARGPLPSKARQLYADHHAGEPGAQPVTSAAEPSAAATTPGERPPRTRRAAGVRWERFWPRRGDGPRPKRKPSRNRASLQGFIEDLWGDMAYFAGPIRPLQRMLQAQAPFAGVMFEDTVKGTAVDLVMQPMARNVDALRAVNAIMGPPVFTAGICLTGVRDPETGEPDARTKAMFLGLKYSLVQMAKVSGRRLAQIQEASDQAVARGQEIDTFIEWLFHIDMPGDPNVPGVSPEEEAIRRAQALLGGQDDGGEPPAGG